MPSDYLPSILDPPFECPDCGVDCEDGIVYDPSVAERVDAWICPRCDSRFYREVDGEVHLRGVPRRKSRGFIGDLLNPRRR